MKNSLVTDLRMFLSSGSAPASDQPFSYNFNKISQPALLALKEIIIKNKNKHTYLDMFKFINMLPSIINYKDFENIINDLEFNRKSTLTLIQDHPEVFFNLYDHHNYKRFFLLVAAKNNLKFSDFYKDYLKYALSTSSFTANFTNEEKKLIVLDQKEIDDLYLLAYKQNVSSRYPNLLTLLFRLDLRPTNPEIIKYLVKNYLNNNENIFRSASRSYQNSNIQKFYVFFKQMLADNITGGLNLAKHKTLEKAFNVKLGISLCVLEQKNFLNKEEIKELRRFFENQKISAAMPKPSALRKQKL